MTSAAATHPGHVGGIWRYPVKSMMGEELSTAAVTERGLFGDRAFAMVDRESGKVISAKNPRKWGDLFAFGAVFPENTDQAGPLPAARITFPDGSSASTAELDIDDRLSGRLNRPVRLTASAPQTASIEGYWPDYHWLEQPDEVFNVELPPGTFFDCAPIHLVTTATLHQLGALSPKSRFEIPRFRPNFVIDCTDSVEGFVENDWVGRTVSIGSEVRLLVVQPTARCVMTTLPQRDLPKDPDVLRTIVQKNKGSVGVYATVVRGGTVRRGDAVALA